MSRLTPISVPLDLILQFTRTSPTFTRQARIVAFQELINLCNRMMDHRLKAQRAVFETYGIGKAHLERLNAIRANLPSDVHGKFATMTEQVKTHSEKEVEAAERDLNGLLDVRLDAELERECPLSESCDVVNC